MKPGRFILLGLSLFFGQTKSIVEKCPVNSFGMRLNSLGNTGACFSYIDGGSIVSQQNAQAACRQSYRGYLARIEDTEVLGSVARSLRDINTNNIWIDLKCNVNTMNCTWSDNSYIGDVMLARGDSPFTSTCGALRNDEEAKYQRWNTIECQAHHPFLCQAPKIVLDVEKCGNDSFKFGDKCYVILTTARTENSSRSQCQNKGGSLASLDSQELIIAATNYLNLEATFSTNNDIWVDSVFGDNSPQQVVLMTTTRTGLEILDSHTQWYYQRSFTATTQAYALCSVEDISQTTTDATSAMSTNHTDELLVSTTKSQTVVSSDGTVIVVVALVVATFLVLIVVLVIVMYKKRSRTKDNEKEKRLPEGPFILTGCCRKHSADSTGDSNLPENITPTATSDSLPNGNVRERLDRFSQTNHSYQQIADVNFDNLYHTIDVGGTQNGDETYSQIYKTKPSPRKSNPGQNRDVKQTPYLNDKLVKKENEKKRLKQKHKKYSATSPTELNYADIQLPPDEETANASPYTVTVHPLPEGDYENTNQAKVSATKENKPTTLKEDATAEVNYASLQLSPDEEISSGPGTGMHYAELLLQDEDEKYDQGE